MATRRFIDLLTEQYRRPAQERAEWVTLQLRQLLSGSVLNSWHIEDLFPTVGHRVLIGVATWNGYDLRLLDALTETIHELGAQERIDVFEIEEEARTSGGYGYFDRVIPGIGEIYQTPLVGIWESGALKQRGSGFVGRKLVVDRYNLNNDVINGQQNVAL
jgi:hypothetical protein